MRLSDRVAVTDVMLPKTLSRLGLEVRNTAAKNYHSQVDKLKSGNLASSIASLPAVPVLKTE